MAVLSPAALILCLLHPAPLIGENDQARAVNEYHTARIRSVLESQGRKMTPTAKVTLTRSIMEASDQCALDPMLVLAVIQVESRFDHKAISSQGAQGLMQIQPAVVTALVEEGRIPFEQKTNLNLIDPLVNVKVGASYLAHLKERFGDLNVALTAYNSGPTWVSKRLAAKETLPLAYASKVLTTQRALENRLALMQTSFPEFSATATKDNKG
jgi:soluble lytic murein transglycosylase